MSMWKAPAIGAGLSATLAVAVMVMAFLVVMVAAYSRSLGPLDLATADRLALGLWSIGPVAGGVLARSGRFVELGRSAITLGVVIGSCVTLFFVFGSGAGPYTCSIDLGALSYPVGCLLVGGLTGTGVGIGFLVSGTASRRPITVLPGVVFAGAVVLLTSLAAKDLFYDAVRCLS